MNLAQLGGEIWSEAGAIPGDKKHVSVFIDEVSDLKMSNSIGDILQLKREKFSRKFVGTASADVLGSTVGTNAHSPLIKTKKSIRAPLVPSLRKTVESSLSSVVERPPERKDIWRLEQELLSQIRLLMSEDQSDANAIESGSEYQPQRVKFAITKSNLLVEFNSTEENLVFQPWLERLIKADCMKTICDETTGKLADMISVSSAELGIVTRNVRKSFRQTFTQMRRSWVTLHSEFVKTTLELESVRRNEEVLKENVKNKEAEVRSRLDGELQDLTEQFEIERNEYKEQLKNSEIELEETSQTLKTLNAIFKTMQTDSSVTSTGDLLAKCERLQKEVLSLRSDNVSMELASRSLDASQTRILQMERQLKQQENEIAIVRAQLHRRDETIAMLMEKDALRNAEIEKLTKIATLMAEKDEAEDLEFQEPPTSILCVKCKKSLDDLSNIRAAVVGVSGGARIQCQTFRILLPNIKGRRPHRSNEWMRACMRSILSLKMREDVTLVAIKGEITRFPEYVYAWFEPVPEIASKDKQSTAAQRQMHADDHRWGFYYGLRALAKDDPETVLFWALLDEAQGEDGLAFVLYCMSVLLSIGGAELWNQFGFCLDKCAGPHHLDDRNLSGIHPVIWLHLTSAKTAVKIIFAKAQEVQIKNAIDSIDAMKELPTVADPFIADSGDTELSITQHPSNQPQIQTPSQTSPSSEECTHINFFSFLRLLLHLYDEERLQRAAAVRLMFETASVGALTPQMNITGSASTEANQHVEFPQFQAITRTLSPVISVAEVSKLYANCYELGKGRVTAEIFLSIADKCSIFSRWMRLPPLPLFSSVSPLNILTEEKNEKTDGDDIIVSNDDANNITTDIVMESSPDEKIAPMSSDIVSAPTDTTEANLLITEMKLRAEIGSLVHRKLAAIRPVLHCDLPEKWRALIMDSLEMVTTSLKEATSKKSGRSYLNESAVGIRDDNSDSQLTHPRPGGNIDGIQPFVHYQRLLSMLLAVRSFSVNPILPGALFRTTREKLLSGLQIDLTRADELITALESALCSCGSPKTSGESASDPTLASAVFVYPKRYERNRKNILARRIQYIYKRYVGSNLVTLPSAIREHMRVDYLRGTNGIKARKTLYEPWHVQSIIAEIYLFKLQHDARAVRFGESPLALCEAATGCLLARWGVIDVAERFLHDTCYSAKKYQFSLPRLRLFLCFLGISIDIDNELTSILSTETAFIYYMDLISALHYLLAADTGELSSIGGHQPSPIRVAVLFPSSLYDLAEKRDRWLIDGDSIRKNISFLSLHLAGIEEESLLLLIGYMKLDSRGRMDVDDFMWLVMMQWAKNMQMLHRKCDDKMQWFMRQEEQKSRIRGKISVTKSIDKGKQKQSVSFYSTKNLVELQSIKSQLSVTPAEKTVAAIPAGLLSAGDMRCGELYIKYMVKRQMSTGTSPALSLGEVLKSCAIWSLYLDSPDSLLSSSSSCHWYSCFGFRGVIVYDMASSPSLSMEIARKTWIAYKNTIMQFIEEFSVLSDVSSACSSTNSSSTAASSTSHQGTESSRLLQLVRRLHLRLEEVFYGRAKDDAIAGAEQETLPTSGLVEVGDAFPAASMAEAIEVSQALQMLFGMLHELNKIENGSNIFPTDSWRGGSKLLLERSPVYNINIAAPSRK